MRSYVFTDRGLTKHARRFVWLSVDTERPENASFLEKFPIDSYPTLLVVDPRAETVALKWLGSATVPQLEQLLMDAGHALQKEDASLATATLAEADRRYGQGKLNESIDLYRQALDAGGSDWPRRSRALESLLTALSSAGRSAECARAARAGVPALPRGPSFANAAALGLSCALELDAQPEQQAALEPLVDEALGLPGLLADDRSTLYELSADARASRHDGAGEQQRLREWLTFLESEAGRAPSAEARAVFDPHRVTAALRLKDPARAVAALEQSERDLPGDYNPPARLATLYLALDRLPMALAANDRALARVYGPRKIQVLETRAKIQLRRGSKRAAAEALEQAMVVANQLPTGTRQKKTQERLGVALKALEVPSPEP